MICGSTRLCGWKRVAAPYFTDVDGHEYLDMYVADMSAFCGHAPSAVVEAVKRLAQTTPRDGWDARDEPATVVPPPDKLRLSQ